MNPREVVGSCSSVVLRNVLFPIALYVVLVACWFAGPAVGAPLTKPEISLLRAMNRARASAGLPPLHLSAPLQRVARGHTVDMARHQYFGHGRFGIRLFGSGVRARVVGENLAWLSGRRTSAAAVVRMWLSSPAHRANLLRPGFRLVGVAAVRGRLRGVGRVSMITADFAGR